MLACIQTIHDKEGMAKKKHIYHWIQREMVHILERVIMHLNDGYNDGFSLSKTPLRSFHMPRPQL